MALGFFVFPKETAKPKKTNSNRLTPFMFYRVHITGTEGGCQ